MAYGVNASFGLKINRLNYGPYTGQVNEYPIASGYNTAIFTQDPVISLADGTIGIGVAGSPIRGIFMGVKYTDTLGVVRFSPFWPASTTVFAGTIPAALVADDPNLILDVQETNAAGSGAGTPIALADRNLNINFRIGTGSTVTGLSGATLNNETEATTATLNLKILGLTPVQGNAVGAFANWLCAINAHELKGGTGTPGL